MSHDSHLIAGGAAESDADAGEIAGETAVIVVVGGGGVGDLAIVAVVPMTGFLSTLSSTTLSIRFLSGGGDDSDDGSC